MKTSINHPKLGGDVVEKRTKVPQRKPVKAMSGIEMLNKAAYGTPTPLTEQEKRSEEWNKLIQ